MKSFFKSCDKLNCEKAWCYTDIDENFSDTISSDVYIRKTTPLKTRGSVYPQVPLDLNLAHWRSIGRGCKVFPDLK